MEGVCHNLFLQSKAKIDYTELHQQLEKLCNKKKINTQKVTALLQKLSLFRLNLNLIPILLNRM